MTAHVVDKPEHAQETAAPSQKNGPQTNQPTNKQTGFDLSVSFTNWPSIQATANDLKIPQKPVALSENDLCDSLIDSSNLPPTSGRTKKLAPSNLFTAAKASSREYRCTGEKA